MASAFKREVPGDAVIDESLAAELRAKKEHERATGRARAKKSHQRRKAARRGSAPKTSSASSAASSDPAPAAASSTSSLGDVLNEEAPPEELTREEQAARAALEQFGSPEKFAGFMAQMQKVAEVAVRKSDRGAKVVAALDWATPDGKPTDNCMMGVQLAWPWLEGGGLDFLAWFGPGFMAALGGVLLFGPAIIVALDEYENHKADREEKRKAAAAAAKADEQVIELNKKEARA